MARIPDIGIRGLSDNLQTLGSNRRKSITQEMSDSDNSSEQIDEFVGATKLNTLSNLRESLLAGLEIKFWNDNILPSLTKGIELAKKHQA